VITEATVKLQETEGRRRTRWCTFRDSGGIAVGSTYLLPMGGSKTEWRIDAIKLDEDDDQA
jgi:hypothetical protein